MFIGTDICWNEEPEIEQFSTIFLIANFNLWMRVCCLSQTGNYFFVCYQTRNAHTHISLTPVWQRGVPTLISMHDCSHRDIAMQHLKAASFLEKTIAASGGTQTHNILHTVQMFCWLNYVAVILVPLLSCYFSCLLCFAFCQNRIIIQIRPQCKNKTDMEGSKYVFGPPHIMSINVNRATNRMATGWLIFWWNWQSGNETVMGFEFVLWVIRIF